MRFPGEIESIRGELDTILVEVSEDFEFRDWVLGPLKAPGKILDIGSGPTLGTLALLVAQSIAGSYSQVLPAAAALELLSAAADCFDDVEDLSSSLSAQELSQKANTGTALLFLSQRALSQLRSTVGPELALKAWAIVAEAGGKACMGQHRDLTAMNTDLAAYNEESYIATVELKSGTLLECACRLGAMLAPADEQAIDAFALFGHDLGAAAQLKNDALTFGSSAAAFEELSSLKLTLPMIYAVKHASGHQKHLLAQFLQRRDSLTPEKAEQLRKAVAEIGGVHYTLIRAELFRQRATATLQSPELKRFSLPKLFEFVEELA